MMNLKQAVVFAVLMESRDGILNKSPSYVLEKLRQVESLDEPEALLDASSRVSYELYFEFWEG